MIPKPLSEIEWADLEVLKDSGREEDDTIEYKASFSGGSDYLAFSGAALEKAQKGIAREAIAFLNGRGGDIVIGAEEASNEASKISQFKPLENVSATAERLAQSLAALIEPHQSVLGVRAIRVDGTDTGVIVVRAPQSLRAPHRFTRDKECYVRRGRESVAMPMDEVHDLVVRRYRDRQERMAIVSRHLSVAEGASIRRYSIDGPRLHLRIVFVPHSDEPIPIDDRDLLLLTSTTPRAISGGKEIEIDDPFSIIVPTWHPTVRGRTQFFHEAGHRHHALKFLGREVRDDGSLIFDLVYRVPVTLESGRGNVFLCSPEWFGDFVASALTTIARFTEFYTSKAFGTIGARFRCKEPFGLGFGRDLQIYVPVPDGTVELPTHEVNGSASVLELMPMLYRDIYALAEKRPTFTYTLDLP